MSGKAIIIKLRKSFSSTLPFHSIPGDPVDMPDTASTLICSLSFADGYENTH